MKTINVTLKQGGWLPPGGSPYWANHKEDWNKLRAYREALKVDLKVKSVSVNIDLHEWAFALGLTNKEAPEHSKNELKDLFFRRMSGFMQAGSVFDKQSEPQKKEKEEIEK